MTTIPPITILYSGTQCSIYCVVG